jgi:hypothetical protein
VYKDIQTGYNVSSFVSVALYVCIYITCTCTLYMYSICPVGFIENKLKKLYDDW